MFHVQAGRVRLAVEQRGQGTPVLLLHGFPLHHGMWSAQVEALSASHRVIAPDLRGFGSSDVTAGTVTMEQYAADVAALLDALEVSEPATLAGFSMGGYVAWAFWRACRERVRALILVDTRAAADSPEAAKARLVNAERTIAEGSQVMADAMLGKLLAPATLSGSPTLVEAVRTMMLAAPPVGIAAALRGMACRTSAEDLLAGIDVPVLAVCGREDVISPAAEMQAWCARLPRGRFVEIAGAGHLAPMEQPAAVTGALGEFLAGL